MRHRILTGNDTRNLLKHYSLAKVWKHWAAPAPRYVWCLPEHPTRARAHQPKKNAIDMQHHPDIRQTIPPAKLWDI